MDVCANFVLVVAPGVMAADSRRELLVGPHDPAEVSLPPDDGGGAVGKRERDHPRTEGDGRSPTAWKQNWRCNREGEEGQPRGLGGTITAR